MTRGCASARDFIPFFHFSFFFDSLFPPLSPLVRWERKPDRGSLRPLRSPCTTSSTSREKEKKREEKIEKEGERGTRDRGINREDRRGPFELTNPAHGHMRAMRERFLPTSKIVTTLVRCSAGSWENRANRTLVTNGTVLSLISRDTWRASRSASTIRAVIVCGDRSSSHPEPILASNVSRVNANASVPRKG